MSARKAQREVSAVGCKGAGPKGEECGLPTIARGLCRAHYQRHYRGSKKTEEFPIRLARRPPQRVLALHLSSQTVASLTKTAELEKVSTGILSRTILEGFAETLRARPFVAAQLLQDFEGVSPKPFLKKFDVVNAPLSKEASTFFMKIAQMANFTRLRGEHGFNNAEAMRRVLEAWAAGRLSL